MKTPWAPRTRQNSHRARDRATYPRLWNLLVLLDQLGSPFKWDYTQMSEAHKRIAMRQKDGR